MRGRGRGGRGGPTTLPAKPKGWEDAKNQLTTLVGTKGHVGWGFGLIARPAGSPPLAEGELHQGTWNLYVYSDDASLVVPADIKNIPITKRGVPAATSAAGPTRRGSKQ